MIGKMVLCRLQTIRPPQRCRAIGKRRVTRGGIVRYSMHRFVKPMLRIADQVHEVIRRFGMAGTVSKTQAVFKQVQESDRQTIVDCKRSMEVSWSVRWLMDRCNRCRLQSTRSSFEMLATRWTGIQCRWIDICEVCKIEIGTESRTGTMVPVYGEGDRDDCEGTGTGVPVYI